MVIEQDVVRFEAFHHHWYKKFKSVLEEIGLTETANDPCIFSDEFAWELTVAATKGTNNSNPQAYAVLTLKGTPPLFRKSTSLYMPAWMSITLCFTSLIWKRRRGFDGPLTARQQLSSCIVLTTSLGRRSLGPGTMTAMCPSTRASQRSASTRLTGLG